MDFLAVFIGGGVGSMLRYGISKWLGVHDSGFPLATFLANVLSCIVLAAAFQYFANRSDMSQAYKVLILTGFCGGFSTFSTFSLETYQLIQQQAYGMAAVYVLASIAVCLLIMRWLLH